MTHKYRIRNTEPGHFFAEYRLCLGWEVIKPFSGFDDYFYTEADARNRIEVDIRDNLRAAANRATRTALLKDYPKIIAFIPSKDPS